MSMPRVFPFLLALGSLVFGAGHALIAGHTVDRSPVGTVRALQAGLEHDPEDLVGRTIVVRGLVEGCPYARPGPCASWPPTLTGPSAATAVPGFPLVLSPAPRDPLTAMLLRLPLLRNLAAAPPAIPWGAVATYRLRVQVGPASACIQAPCYQALVLDIAR